MENEFFKIIKVASHTNFISLILNGTYFVIIILYIHFRKEKNLQIQYQSMKNIIAEDLDRTKKDLDITHEKPEKLPFSSSNKIKSETVLLNNFMLNDDYNIKDSINKSSVSYDNEQSNIPNQTISPYSNSSYKFNFNDNQRKSIFGYNLDSNYNTSVSSLDKNDTIQENKNKPLRESSPNSSNSIKDLRPEDFSSKTITNLIFVITLPIELLNHCRKEYLNLIYIILTITTTLINRNLVGIFNLFLILVICINF